MSCYEVFKDFLNSFNEGSHLKLEKQLYELSYDDQNMVYVYDINQTQLRALSFDEFCEIYREMRFSNQEITRLHDMGADSRYKSEYRTEQMKLASVDAFLIDKNEDWYMIEFKNQKISSTKESVVEKAYQNYYWLCDLFYKSKDKALKPYFDYDNPIEFARRHVTFILVVSSCDKNKSDAELMVELHDAHDCYRTPFMEKLRHYIYKDAYVYTNDLFEKYFVKSFKYE